MNPEQAIGVAKASGYTSWTAAFYALFQGMSKDDVAMWTGVGIAFVGMTLQTSITWHYKRKADKREQLELAARLRGDIP